MDTELDTQKKHHVIMKVEAEVMNLQMSGQENCYPPTRSQGRCQNTFSLGVFRLETNMVTH